MIRIQTLAIPLILCLAGNPLIIHASPQPSDPLQIYRDEIKQAENNATQKLIDQLGPTISDSKSYTNTPSTPPSSPSLPNNEKAFSPSAETQKNVRSQTQVNPWEKPNPWAAQSKVNPWANAPIPGPTPSLPAAPNASTAPISPPSPPNIFAPSQPANMPSKLPNKPANTTY